MALFYQYDMIIMWIAGMGMGGEFMWDGDKIVETGW